MNSPTVYYGGKTRLLSEILPLIPDHIQYVEPFLGGGSVFWAKRKSKNEVINDINGDVTNWYMQLKTNFVELQKLIKGTLHSEVHYNEAKQLINNADTPALQRAWAFWVGCNQSFSGELFYGFAFSENGYASFVKNKRDSLIEQYAKRLEHCEIFERDAIELIKLKDSENTFFYLDPPYVSSEQGHYAGYTKEHFKNLLDVLINVKGKFLLSSYPEQDLITYRLENKWKYKDIKQIVGVHGNRQQTKYKTECLTWNYNLNQLCLFHAI